LRPIIPRLEGNPPLKVWSALREVDSTSPTVTLVTLYRVRWMVPIILCLCLIKVKKWSSRHRQLQK
jgi:uncharacterized membrane protein YadS